MVASGALGADDALEIVRLRVELVDALLEPRDWVMASLTRVDPEAVRRTAEELQQLRVVSENGPADCVVVAAPSAFAALVERLAPRHRPLPGPAADPAVPTRRSWRPWPMRWRPSSPTCRSSNPRRPMISPTGPRLVEDAATARATVVEALVNPVRWSSAPAWAAGEHPQAQWRECGPAGYLGRFTRKNGLTDLDWAEA